MGGHSEVPHPKKSPREGGFDGILHQGRAEEPGRESGEAGKAKQRKREG